MDVISLLKLLKELLPADVYKKIARLILDMLESPESVDFEFWSKELIRWVQANYPDLEKLIRLILKRLAPSTTAEGGGSAVVVTEGALPALGIGLLPAVLLFGGGLLLPGSKLGKPEWDWQAWWRDPCEDHFSEIADDYVDYNHDRGNFPTGASRKSVMALLGKASSLINECQKWLKNCPKSKRAQTVRSILEAAEKGRDEYLDWLVTH